MADERLKAVGDIEKAYKQINDEFERSKKAVQDLTVVTNTLKDSQKELLDVAKSYKDVLKSTNDPKTIAALRETQTFHQKVDETIKKHITTTKELEDAEKKLMAERVKELQLQKAREKAVDDFTRKELASQKAIEKSRIDELRLQKAREKAVDDYTKKELQLQKAREKAKKTIEDEANAYKTLVRQTDKSQAEFKKLAAQYGVNSRQAQAARVKFEQLDNALRKVNAAARDGLRDVGRYGEAWRTAQSTLNKFGVGISIGFAAREGVRVLREFEEASADMAKTLGVSVDVAKELSMELLKLETGTAIEDLQKIAAIGGQMGIAKEDIIGFTASIDKLNVSLGDEFTGGAEEITREVGGLRNVLQDIKTDDVAEDVLRIGNALNVLGASGNATAPVITDFSKRISGIGIPLGLSTDQILGMSATLQELGVDAERGGTAVGRILQKMTTDVDGFAKLAGVPVDEFTNMINTDLYGAFQQVLKGTNKFKGDSVGLGTVLSDLGLEGSGASEVFLKLGGNIEFMNEKVALSGEALQNTDSIMEEFNTKNSTLGATIGYATNKIKEQLLEFDKSNGIALKLKNTIKFLADNFELIVTGLGKVIKAFVIFKGVMGGIRLVDRIKEWSSWRKEVAKGAESVGEASEGSKRFGQALKGAITTAVIALVMELAVAWLKVASGAKQAKEFVDAYNESASKQGDKAQANIDKINKQAQKEIDAIRLRKLGAEEEARLINDVNKRREQQLSSFADYQRKNAYQSAERLKQLKAERQALFDATIGGEDVLRATAASSDFGLGVKNPAIQRLEVLDKLITKYGSSVAGAAAKTKLYSDATDSVNQELLEFQINEGTLTETVVDGTGAVNTRTEAIEKETRAYKDLTEQLNAAEEAERTRLELVEDFNISGAEKNTESAIDQAKKAAEETGIIESERINNALANEEKLKRAKIERLYFERVEEAKNAEEVELAMEQYNQDVQSLDEEIFNRKNQLFEELNTAQEDYDKERLDAQQALLDAEIAAEEAAEEEKEKNRKKWLDAAKRTLDELAKATDEYADGRVESQERIIASEEKLLEAIQSGAEKGSLEQSQSIAKQEQKITEAQAEKIRLEREKQAIEFATAAITTFTNSLEGGATVPEAFADVALSQAGLKLILDQLPKYFHGTEDTGTKGVFNDQFGAVTGVTHANERVLTANDNAKLKGIDNDTLVDSALKYMELQRNPAIGMDGYIQMMMMQPHISTPIFDDDRMVKEIGFLKKEMKGIRKDLQNLTFPESNVGEIIGQAMTIIDKDSKGNSVHTVLRKPRNSNFGKTQA
jgi:TP901 family phage tail tape measure protein